MSTTTRNASPTASPATALSSQRRELGVLLDKALEDPTVVRLSEVADAAVTDATVRRFGDLVSGLYRHRERGRRR
jgi:hypothetical protein